MLNAKTAQLIGAGRLLAEPDWFMSTHTHSFWEFIYFLNGAGRIDVPEATFWPQQYHLVVYPPGLPHAEFSDPVHPEETIFFSFDIPGASSVGEHLLLPDQKGEMSWLCRHIFEEVTENGLTELAQTYGQAFLHLVDRAWETSFKVRHDAVDRAVQYLHANYAKDVGLAELADIACLSKTHLAHRFQDRLGTSPLRYLQRLRLEAAKRMLLTTHLAVNEIAVEVGFKDPLYFSRVLKRATGKSPSAFRNDIHLADNTVHVPCEPTQ